MHRVEPSRVEACRQAPAHELRRLKSLAVGIEQNLARVLVEQVAASGPHVLQVVDNEAFVLRSLPDERSDALALRRLEPHTHQFVP